MLTKFKYVGVSKKDLLDVYVLFVRSLLEYCAVVWHSRLTQEQGNNLEIVQKSCLRVILGEQYVNYENALEICELKTLTERRQDRCLKFAQKCLEHPIQRRLFPPNPGKSHKLRENEKYFVNF